MKAAISLAVIIFAGAIGLGFALPGWTNYGAAGLILLWGGGSLTFQADLARRRPLD